MPLSRSDRGASGFLVIDKPSGWTSFDVVAKLRSITGQRKVGHAGTLDPFATGVLVVAFNDALKVVEYVGLTDKTYRGRIRLGQTSDTDDLDGSKTDVPVATTPDEADVRLALAKQTGAIEQLPPNFAALKVRGKPMYKLARMGKPVDRTPRHVVVHELALLAYTYPTIDIACRVSSGTYIRAIARDVGADLKTGGLLEELQRTRVGPFELADACTLDDVQHRPLPELLRPLEEAVETLPKLSLSAENLRRLANGEVVKAPGELASKPDLPDVAVADNGRLVMVVRYDSGAGTVKAKKLIDVGLASR